ncbi:hypothetical protein BC828DRAFT_383873 [Blastocladiella britannica]|nr:hypothetical protein BC828DRAFT_383873 [Blastocladiella britannica]
MVCNAPLHCCARPLSWSAVLSLVGANNGAHRRCAQPMVRPCPRVCGACRLSTKYRDRPPTACSPLHAAPADCPAAATWTVVLLSVPANTILTMGAFFRYIQRFAAVCLPAAAAAARIGSCGFLLLRME